MSKGLKMLAINRTRQGGGQGGQGARNEMRNGYGEAESDRGNQMRNETREGYGVMEPETRGGQTRKEMRVGYEMENEMRGEPRSEMEMGGAEMRRRYSRDRRGRFTGEMENEMEMESGGRWLPPYYDVDINRYEQPKGNYGESNYRGEMEQRSGRDSGGRGGGNRSQNEGGNMRMIGFGREIYNNDMRSDASIPKYREGDHMMGEKPKKGGVKSEMGMDEHVAKEWTSKMENEDGTKGPHWSMEQIKKVIEQRNMPGDPVEIWVAMNMMYSDYCKVAKKLGVNTMDFYAEMARAFLEDKDAGVPDKLTSYYEYIVKG